MQTDVLIVGAGAAGLMAARELSKARRKVIILEARDRVGGRIYQLDEKEWGYPAQGGAEFVHGEAPATKALIAQAGLTLNYPIEWWNVLDRKPRISERVSPHDPLLEEKLKLLKKDLPISEFLNRYFPGDNYAGLRDYVMRRTEGYEAADPLRASTFTLRDEMLSEGEWSQMSIKEGYGALMNFLFEQCKKNGVKIIFNHKVTQVHHVGEVKVVCADGGTHESARAVVTVPLGVLGDISFVPEIREVSEAVSQVGFGGVIKILLRFKNRWWATPEREENFEKLFFMFSREEIPTWWTQYPELHPVLTGWVAGPSAAALGTKSDAELVSIALCSLSNIFKIDQSELKKELVVYKVCDWVRDPFAKGAYSYATVQSAVALQKLAEPIDGSIFFAGEAFDTSGAASTVEGALASGLETARRILNS